MPLQVVVAQVSFAFAPLIYGLPICGKGNVVDPLDTRRKRLFRLSVVEATHLAGTGDARPVKKPYAKNTKGRIEELLTERGQVAIRVILIGARFIGLPDTEKSTTSSMAMPAVVKGNPPGPRSTKRRGPRGRVGRLVFNPSSPRSAHGPWPMAGSAAATTPP